MQCYQWNASVAAIIQTLPAPLSTTTWGLSPTLCSGDVPCPPEVLAYLVRTAYQAGELDLENRAFSALMHCVRLHVLAYAQRYQHHLQRAVTVEDVVSVILAMLSQRLRTAPGISFYECAFRLALKKNVQAYLARTAYGWPPLFSLSASGHGEGDGEIEPADPSVPSLEEQILFEEEAHEFGPRVQAILATLPKRVRAAAVLMVGGRTQEEIGAQLGVSSRMVRYYKKLLQEAFQGFVKA